MRPTEESRGVQYYQLSLKNRQLITMKIAVYIPIYIQTLSTPQVKMRTKIMGFELLALRETMAQQWGNPAALRLSA